MTQPLRPFGSTEKAVMALLEREYPPLQADPQQVGGSFSADLANDEWFIMVTQVPGGRAGRLEGTWLIELSVFSADYDAAESVALDLEALVLRYPHVVEVDDRKVVLDRVYQTSGVAPLPWEVTESVYRLGATYSITARRL